MLCCCNNDAVDTAEPAQQEPEPATAPSANDDGVGYVADFIGVQVPLPTFHETTLDPNVLKKDSFDQGAWRQFIHYSVATNQQRRQPICVALNIIQALLKTGTNRRGWKEDLQVGKDYQLNNDYYKNNDWDRGHMANRSNAAWGETDEDAQRASDDTMYYTNSCLQHANLNQDEWLQVENWVKSLSEDSNDKMSVFSGPFYSTPGGEDAGVSQKFLEPEGRPAAEIPTGFFKVVVFMNKEHSLATRAFIYYQDDEALEDKRGSRMKKHTSYQVSTAQVEEKTGLIFPEMLHSSNPVSAEDGATAVSQETIS